MRTPGRTGGCISTSARWRARSWTVRSHPCRSRSSVRVTRCAIANVLDAVLPDVKADEPEQTFPGALGRLVLAGRGRTNRMEGVGVLSVCDWLAAGYTNRRSSRTRSSTWPGPGREMTRVGIGRSTSWCDASRRRAPRSATWIEPCGARRWGWRATRRHDDRHGAEPGRDDRTTARRRRSRSPGDLRDPAGRVRGTADRHVPLRARGRRDRSHRRSIRSSCWTER